MRLSARLIRPTPPIAGPVTVRLTNAASLASRSFAAPSLRRKKQPPRLTSLGDRDQLKRSIPRRIFKSAVEDKTISISAASADALARQCVDVAAQGKLPHSVKITEILDQDASLIARVAFVLARAQKFYEISNWILLSLAFEGEPIATMIMATGEIIDGKKTDAQILKNLRTIAEEGKIPQAMVLRGKELEQKGHYEQAAGWYEKAMAASKPVSDGSIDIFLRSKVPQPWEAYSSIKEMLGEHDEAKRAINIGVEKYETLSAYRQALPDVLDSGDFGKYETFLTKCAMAGDALSCHQLGNLYLTIYLARVASKGNNSKTSVDAQDLKFADKYPTPELRELAVEWYRIAAAAGQGKSALVLAGLFRQENKLDMGMEYLDLASQDPQCKKALVSLRKRWHDTEAKIDIRKDLMS